MKKFKFLLLDANVVIRLFEWGIWDEVVEHCDVHLARTVVENEALYYCDENGDKQYIDLDPYIQNDHIAVFDVTVSDVQAFRKSFDPSYADRLDPGETESLVYLLGAKGDWKFCSADSIVPRILGNLQRREVAISLEEVLCQIGLTRALPVEFTRAYCENNTKVGFADRFQRKGSRGKLPL